MKQKIYLITGLMASGKSTVSDLLAKSIEKCVHLRGDVFRKMIISGRENMSATPSAEAVRQLYLRYKDVYKRQLQGYGEHLLPSAVPVHIKLKYTLPKMV